MQQGWRLSALSMGHCVTAIPASAAQQPDRRTQWKQRAVCPAVPSPVQCGSEQQKEYVLSPKDICTLDLIPELIEAGVYSFKIEGRMKRPEYVAAVTSIYRKYTDL